jgi:plasmid stability protein
MASLTIRKLDASVQENLRRRAARHARSMEEEARRILSETCAPGREPTNALSSCGGISVRRARAARLRLMARRMYVVDTRDEAGFAGCGVPIVNPRRRHGPSSRRRVMRLSRT